MGSASVHKRQCEKTNKRTKYVAGFHQLFSRVRDNHDRVYTARRLWEDVAGNESRPAFYNGGRLVSSHIPELQPGQAVAGLLFSSHHRCQRSRFRMTSSGGCSVMNA